MRGSLGDLGETPQAAIAAAYAALDQGHLQKARDLAKYVLIRARGSDLHSEARALACLAHCDRIGSRLRRASEASRRAAQLFEQLGDLQGESNALATLAHVCMLLGRNDEAVEAALLCVRLCDVKLPQPQAVLAHNCLGLAYAWSGDFERADASLETAVALARRCVPPLGIYQPRLNQMWVESTRLMNERYQTGAMGSLARLEALGHECAQLEREGLGVLVLQGLQPMARTASLASAGLLASWQGDLAAARVALDAAAGSLSGGMTWLDAFVRWVAAELAWAEQNWDEAARALIEMREMALVVEHEQLACQAHLLLAQVYELHGKNDEARREHRALRRRERRVAAEGLSSRESLVSWQLGVRQSERHLRQALVASRQFERWSLEDALTGLANHRHFEQSLAERLPAAIGAGRTLTVAMVNVDRFESIAECFAHGIGDRVLKTVAAILASEVRENDLPVRWAGHAFVILFDAAEPVARQVCERIEAAVADFDWQAIAPGLQLSVGMGLSEVRAGDTAETAVQRGDEAMARARPLEPATV